MKAIRYVASAAAALLLCNLALGAKGDESTVSLDIKAQPMVEALNAFARQTGLQLIFPAEEIAAGVIAPSLVGQYSPRAALTQLLANSGLVYSYVNDRTVAIRASKPEKPSKAEAQTSASQPLLHLAWADETQPQRDEKSLNIKADGNEMVVTGSHIRGVRNDTAPIVILDREYIERSGFSNTMQLVESLPQNFKGGNSQASEEAMFGDASVVGQNLSRGTGFNLRGLGAISTLTLINGRRMAPSAQGQFVDVSLIPINAIERVEVLTDGASAIYGADAISGVVNIILRKDFDGAETLLSTGTSTQGGAEEARLSQTLGAHWNSGNALFMADYYKREPVDVQERDFISTAGAPGPTYVLPQRTLYSLVGNVDQDLPGAFDLTASAIVSYQDVTSYTTGIGDVTPGSTSTAITNKTQWSAVLGLGYEPFRDWRFALEGSMGRSRPSTDLNRINPANGLRYPLWLDFIMDFKTWEGSLKGDGTLFRLPGGAVRMAAGVSYRNDELLSKRTSVRYLTGNPFVERDRAFSIRAADARNVRSAFAEIYMPLVGPSQNLGWAYRIDLSIAGRYDSYSDFGSTTNPKVGLVWSPGENLDVRAAYSTSFRAPNVSEKARGTGQQFVYTYPFDAADGTLGVVPFLVLEGGTPLGPEESENLAFGLTWRPGFASGLRLSLNYFDIDYTNRITTPPFDTGVLARREDFGDLITEFPNDAAAQAFLDDRVALGDFFFDFLGTGDASGVLYLYDFRTTNAARTQMTGFDLTTGYTFEIAGNIFDLNVSIARINDIETSLTANSSTFSEVDNFQRPLDWRMRGMGTWTRGPLATTVSVNYADRYENTSLFADDPIASWTTVDLNLAYAFQSSKLGLTLSNLLDENPPFAFDALSALGYDVANGNPMGRFVAVQYSKRW